MVNQSLFDKSLRAIPTPIDGLTVYDIPMHGDDRGWFKENWQREKMAAVGLPDFQPVQNNISFNSDVGVTRGLHAEPWDKFVSIGAGKVFGAWCDLRKHSPTYGKVFTTELDPSTAIFVPRGVANGFQTLEAKTVYTYLVSDHWSPEASYSNVSLFDNTLNIDWPIPLDKSIISDKDKNHPLLKDASVVTPKKVLITGAHGQLGNALYTLFPDAEGVDIDTLDISSDTVFTARRWRDYDLILNAAAYTAVDNAETPEGRVNAWKANAVAVSNLAKIACENNLTLVHISSDYVFDGTKDIHDENEPFSPLSVYGQTKSAGDIVVATAPKHYIVRTSWVMGNGKNFVRTMKDLAEKGVNPKVVDDQVGRPTFTDDLVRGIKHLVDTKAPYGTYNLSNTGDSVSWATLAKRVFRLAGKDSDCVTGVSTSIYYEGKTDIAPRPASSTLDLAKIISAGFTPREWTAALDEYWKILEQEDA